VTKKTVQLVDGGDTMRYVKILEENRQGRDIVIGDLHGAVTALENLLKANDFNEEVDRVICVGDLMDRGERSVDAINLLDNSWFFSVMGNHEELMIQAMYSTIDKLNWHKNGGEWAEELSTETLVPLFEKISKLPYLTNPRNSPSRIY